MANNKSLETLLELHRVDSEIDKINSQEELLPVSMRRIETRLSRQLQGIEDRKQRLKELRTGTHAKEVDLRGYEEELGRLNRQVRKVRTNKEYTALQHEMASRKVDASRIEDQVLALMADIEDLEKEIKELENSVAQMQREFAEEEGLVKKEVDKLVERRAKLRKERGAAAASVDEELLEEYERIAARKGSSAVAACIGRTCQGCFMQIPPQLDHVLRAGTKIVHCPSCSRILYLP